MFLLSLFIVAIFVLFERKSLGYLQARKGPNKVSLVGLPQSVADALKLFTKESAIPYRSNR